MGWADQIAPVTSYASLSGAGRSLIHERNIADVAVRALLDDRHDGRRYVLTGPETLTQREQVRVIGEVIGRPLRTEEQSPDEFGDQWADALAYWATLVDDPEPVTHTVPDLTGVPARTFREWATDHAADFRQRTTSASRSTWSSSGVVGSR